MVNDIDNLVWNLWRPAQQVTTIVILHYRRYAKVEALNETDVQTYTINLTRPQASGSIRDPKRCHQSLKQLFSIILISASSILTVGYRFY